MKSCETCAHWKGTSRDVQNQIWVTGDCRLEPRQLVVPKHGGRLEFWAYPQMQPTDWCRHWQDKGDTL